MSRNIRLRPSCRSPQDTETLRDNSHGRPASRGNTPPEHPISGGSMSSSPKKGSWESAPCRRMCRGLPVMLQLECSARLYFTRLIMVNETGECAAAIRLYNPQRCLVYLSLWSYSLTQQFCWWIVAVIVRREFSFLTLLDAKSLQTLVTLVQSITKMPFLWSFSRICNLPIAELPITIRSSLGSLNAHCAREDEMGPGRGRSFPELWKTWEFSGCLSKVVNKG